MSGEPVPDSAPCALGGQRPGCRGERPARTACAEPPRAATGPGSTAGQVTCEPRRPGGGRHACRMAAVTGRGGGGETIVQEAPRGMTGPAGHHGAGRGGGGTRRTAL